MIGSSGHCVCCSVAKWCLTHCDPMECSTPGFPVLHYLLEFAQSLSIETMMPSNHLILCCPVSSGPQSFLASQSFPKSWLFTSGGQSIGASASISVLPMNSQGWFPGLFDLLAVQGTLKSLLQHHSSQASVLQCSAFFIVQLSHWYMTTGKTTALTIRCQPVFVYKSVFHIYEAPEGRS